MTISLPAHNRTKRLPSPAAPNGRHGRTLPCCSGRRVHERERARELARPLSWLQAGIRRTATSDATDDCAPVSLSLPLIFLAFIRRGLVRAGPGSRGCRVGRGSLCRPGNTWRPSTSETLIPTRAPTHPGPDTVGCSSVRARDIAHPRARITHAPPPTQPRTLARRTADSTARRSRPRRRRLHRPQRVKVGEGGRSARGFIWPG
jgi:hypothetical protein